MRAIVSPLRGRLPLRAAGPLVVSVMAFLPPAASPARQCSYRDAEESPVRKKPNETWLRLPVRPMLPIRAARLTLNHTLFSCQPALSRPIATRMPSVGTNAVVPSRQAAPQGRDLLLEVVK